MEPFTFVFALSASLHLGPEGKEFNPVHPEINTQNGNYSASIYLNSINRLSVAASKIISTKHPKINVQIGAVSGYVIPISPFVKFNYKVNKKINLFVIPTTYNIDEPKIRPVLGIQYKF